MFLLNLNFITHFKFAELFDVKRTRADVFPARR